MFEMFGPEKHRSVYINHYNERINEGERAIKRAEYLKGNWRESKYLKANTRLYAGFLASH